MGAAYFYHLTRNPVEVTLPQLLDKARQAGWRIAVRGGDAGRMAWLDERLWLAMPREGFAPHGLAGGAHDADQPVLLTVAGQAAANRPDCLMTVDGAALRPDEVTAMQRVCVLFDGNDPDAVARAREQWKALTGAGCAALYWSEESGRWEKKAERPAH
ncbi:MAG: DNA polymerase III subunit chi [Rhodobacteraceae bacterium]|nr:DNA polymerase III subunit chi [Paracoccaceae bacterium]